MPPNKRALQVHSYFDYVTLCRRYVVSAAAAAFISENSISQRKVKHQYNKMVQLNTAVQIGCLDAIYIHVLFKVFHVQFHTQMFDLKEIYSATTAEYRTTS